jgi:RND family efflux transporter MFP subunit
MRTTNQTVRRILLLALASLALGCKSEPPLAEPDPMEVVMSQPVREKIVDWDTYTGTVESRESVDIRARVRGEIKAVKFKDGDDVKEGELLFVIDDDPFQANLKQAKGLLDAWKAKLKAAEERLAIYTPLVEKGTISKDELNQALGAKGEAIGGIDTANGKIKEAEVNIAYCKITSPITGRIGQALLTKGNIVNAGMGENLLTTVVSVDPLYVSFNVNERALQNYKDVIRKQFEKEKKEAEKEEKKKKKAENDAEIPVEMALTNDKGYPHKGFIDFIDNKVDPSTGSIKVRARFKNPKGTDGLRALTPGLFARIRVAIADPYPAILITDRAILSDQSLNYVLIVNKAKDNEVERRDIVPARRVQDDGLKAIESGLKGDEWIIVDGLNRVRPGVNVKPKEAPMPRRPVAAK